MADIVAQIGTPLQLGALLLLLIAGCVRLLIRNGTWKPSSAHARLIINRVSQIIVLALVLIIALPPIMEAINRRTGQDEVFHGAVLSTTGEPVANASVNVLTLGIRHTDLNGQFDLSIPPGRALQTYRIQVSAAGFKSSEVLERSAHAMKNLEIRLTPEKVPLVKSMGEDIMVGQFYGMPFIIANFSIDNATSAIAVMEDVRGSLDFNGRSYVLVPASWTIMGQFGPFAPVTGPFPFPAGARYQLRVMMMPNVNFAPVQRHLASLPGQNGELPCTPHGNAPPPPMGEEAFAVVKAFADQQFMWGEGQGDFSISFLASGERQEHKRAFSLSQDNVAQLKDSVDLLRQCMAINIQAPLAQDGKRANFLMK
jgi:hypothetical protein